MTAHEGSMTHNQPEGEVLISYCTSQSGIFQYFHELQASENIAHKWNIPL
jgi:hypothetical protein